MPEHLDSLDRLAALEDLERYCCLIFYHFKFIFIIVNFKGRREGPWRRMLSLSSTKNRSRILDCY
jgi:hypothetical protein